MRKRLLIRTNQIRMEFFKQYPDSKRTKEWMKKRVKIYSGEHGYYWRGSGQGYTHNPHESDSITGAEAFLSTNHCGPEKSIWFADADAVCTLWSKEHASLTFDQVQTIMLGAIADFDPHVREAIDTALDVLQKEGRK